MTRSFSVGVSIVFLFQWLDSPVSQTPVVQTPVVQTPVVQTPVSQTPVSGTTTPAKYATSSPYTNSDGNYNRLFKFHVL